MNKLYRIIAIFIEYIILFIVGLLILIIATGGFWIGQISITHVRNSLIILLFVVFLRRILFIKFEMKRFIILLNPVSYLFLIFFFVTSLHIWNNYVGWVTFGFSNFHDLALYNQAVFNFIHGNGFENSIWGGIGYSIFAEHSEFFLIPISLIYVFWQSPLTLLYIQAFAVTLGMFPLYFLAKQKFGNSFLSIAICLSYLTFPYILHLSSWTEFRSITFVIPILFTAFYFYEIDKKNIFIALMLLSALVKEEVIPVVAITGLYILIFSKKKKINPRVGLILLLIGTALFFFIIYVFIPFFRGAPYPHFTRFIDGGNIFSSMLKNPLILFTNKEFFSAEKMNYFLNLFLMLGFLPLFSIAFLIPLSNWMQSIFSAMGSIRQHWHNTLIFTFMFISLIFGIYNLKKIHKAFSDISLFILLLMLIIFGLPSFESMVILPLKSREVFAKTLSTEKYKDLKNAIESIPKDKSVYVTFKILPYVSSRRYVYWYPKVVQWSDVDYMIFSNDNDDFLNSQDKDKLKEARKSKLFTKIKTFGEFQVWKRK